MFKSLRDKLKKAVDSFSKGADKDVEEIPEPPQPEPEATAPAEEPKPQAEKPKEVKKEPETEEAPTKKAEPKPTAPEKKTPEKPETTPEPETKKGFFTKLSEKVTTINLTEEKFEELFWDLELALLESNVAVSVIEKIKEDLKQELTTGRTARGALEERVYRRLEESLKEILDQEPLDLLNSAHQHKPLVIAAVGVNGSGKTTSLAKLARYFQKNDKTVVLAACDTFRAAAIQQLQEHADKLKVPIVKQDYGADPAAVAFDAVRHAEAKDIDVVLIDTAGRLHSNRNLMDELEKVMRVAKPHHVIFVGESVTGNDCVEQAAAFSENIPVDGIILTKADVDEKGGAAVSVTHVTGKPVIMIGTGQSYDDLQPFSSDQVISNVLP